MVIGMPVYDCFGNPLLEKDTEIDEACMDALRNGGVSELIIDDWHTRDVPTIPMFAPEMLALLSREFRLLLDELRQRGEISHDAMSRNHAAVRALAAQVATGILGDLNATVKFDHTGYAYLQPLKVVEVSLAMGRSLGLPLDELTRLGLAALLKDIGQVAALPAGVATSTLQADMQDDPQLGYSLLARRPDIEAAVTTGVLEHHERWNGGGYPVGLQGDDIGLFAQVIAIADEFANLLWPKADGLVRMLPHQAIEFVMAGSEVLFNPKLLETFVRQVPFYPAGLTVTLNNGERGIVSNSNVGSVGRPVVRVCYNSNGSERKTPRDLDLSQPNAQNIFITRILDYD
jgi:HD-GYP domain-containing protein (c-di-GMP phosphodiesterase class II)